MHLSKDLKLLEDGLSTISYKVIQREKYPLYTRILVQLPRPDELVKKELYIADSGKLSYSPLKIYFSNRIRYDLVIGKVGC